MNWMKDLLAGQSVCALTLDLVFNENWFAVEAIHFNLVGCHDILDEYIFE